MKIFNWLNILDIHKQFLKEDFFLRRNFVEQAQIINGNLPLQVNNKLVEITREVSVLLRISDVL
jgi:hypothetical protein